MTNGTDILIPLGQGSRHDNLELRYCLRSIEKHLIGVRNVFIVGDKPEWLRGVVYIPERDNPNNWMRAHNIYRKIMAGIKFSFINLSAKPSVNKFEVFDLELSDNFLFMNDDHFLLTDYVAGEFPYYHRGAVDLQALEHHKPQQLQMANTAYMLEDNAFLDFDIHCPVVYNKRLFQNIFSRLPEKWPEYGYGIKSFYNNQGCDITNWAPCEDLKFSEPAMKESIYRLLEGRPWFSIGDRCLKSGGMKEVLQELYPDKSKYEL